MIVTEAYLRILIGLSDDISYEERAALALLHPAAESRVKQALGYDPEQAQVTEYYPRRETSGALVDNIWDVNSRHTHAVLRASRTRGGNCLQLERLPVRAISQVVEDTNARWGQMSGAFSGTPLVAGTDYWLETERPNVSLSGLLHRTGTWPAEPGTVRITYRAGYSRLELAGQADTISDATSSDINGQYTHPLVDASGISRAVYLTVAKAMNTWAQNRKRTSAGWVAGPFTSERLQDYGYTVANNGVAAAMALALPAEAMEELEPFMHWGAMLL